MTGRFALASSMLIPALLGPAALSSPRAATNALPSPFGTTAAQAPRDAQPPNMQEMMTKHEQMMAEMKAANEKLDQLVKEMDAATGDAKVNATAAVVKELVRQHRAMFDRMGQMHQQMMGKRGKMPQ